LIGISTAMAAVGTLAAVGVALYLSAWRERLRRPVLTLTVDRHDGFGTGPTGYLGVASPLVVYERPGSSSVAGSLLLDEAGETATAGLQGP
jgi:hypothetical protein